MKVTLCCRIPIDAYIGGIAVVVNKYVENKDKFLKEDVDLSLFSWHDAKIEQIKNSKIRNLLYWKSFRKASLRYCKQNEPDIFHIHTAREFLFMRDVMVGRLISKKYGTKCALTVHVGAIDTVFNRIPKIFRKFLIKSLNKYFCHVFFLSNEIKEQFISVGLKQEIASVLYNFHDMPTVTPTKKDKDDLNLLFVGAIQREKGITEIINAVNELKDKIGFHLDICGEVNDSSVRELFQNFCNENQAIVESHGYVKGELKYTLFKNADVLILPSYHEGLPLVILEALATGCAVISTKVGTVPEILTEDNAIWVEIKNDKNVVDAIMKLHTDRDLLYNMKLNNVKLAQKFALNDHISELCKQYRSMI